MAKMSRGVKMKNKRKILLVSGIGIVIMAIAIGVTIAVSRPGTMKNSRQAASGQTTESKEKDNELPVLTIGTDTPQSGDDTSTTQSDTGTHGKKASREQAESKGKKNDSKSPDQKNTTGVDSKAKTDKKPSHSEIRSHRILKRIQQNRRIQIAIKAMMAMVKIPLQGQIRQRITIRNRKIRKMVDQTNQIPAKKVRIR